MKAPYGCLYLYMNHIETSKMPAALICAVYAMRFEIRTICECCLFCGLILCLLLLVLKYLLLVLLLLRSFVCVSQWNHLSQNE